MTIDLDSLPKNTLVGEIQTSIGNIFMFSLRVKHMIELEKSLKGKSIKDFSAEDFIRRYMKIICSLKLESNTEEFVSLSSDESEALTLDDLNVLSRAFLKHHNYLYEDTALEYKKDNSQHEKSQLLKKDDEEDYEYLFRLLMIENERWEYQNSAITKLMKPISHFNHENVLGTTLASNLKATSFAGMALNNELYKIKPKQAGLWINTPVTKKAGFIDLGKGLSENLTVESKLKSTIDSALNNESILTNSESVLSELEKTNERIRQQEKEDREREVQSFEILAEQAEHAKKMYSVMVGMSDYMHNLNQTQIQAAIDSKKSSDDSMSLSRKSFYINILVLILSFSALVFSIYQWYLPKQNDIPVNEVEKQVSPEVKADNTPVALKVPNKESLKVGD